MLRQHVFWPIGIRDNGYVFGWQNSSTLLVAGVFAFGNRKNAELALSKANSLISKKELSCPPLELLGEHCGPKEAFPLQVTWYRDQTSTSTLSQKQIMYYKRPKHGSMRHYSLIGVNLDLLLTIPRSEKSISLAAKQSFAQTTQAQFVTRRSCPVRGVDSQILAQMNSAHWAMSLLQTTAKQDVPQEIAKGEWRQSNTVIPVVKRVCSFLLQLFRLLRIHFLHLWGIRSWMLDFMASVQQMDLRWEQFMFILQQAWLLDRAAETSNDSTSAHYISTQNCIWLILNDVIIGFAVGVFLVDNSDNLARMVHEFFMNYTVSLIRTSIFWLDNWPAGLKLNTELSRFLYVVFNALVDVWEVVLALSTYWLPTFIVIMGMAGSLGMTMILALLLDLISVLSIHLSVSYNIIRVVFRTQLLTAKSLFNLFRGKRYNVLRQRLDDWDYDLDQLVLGTMLLMLINFLFPTITVYYMLFALSRFALLMLEAIVKVALALLNHFPLFALTLRIKDPWRLPGGIVLHPYRHSHSSQSSFIIKNLPITLPSIFGQYYTLSSNLANHYSPRRLLIDLVKGNRLDPIPQRSIRYSYGMHES